MGRHYHHLARRPRGWLFPSHSRFEARLRSKGRTGGEGGGLDWSRNPCLKSGSREISLPGLCRKETRETPHGLFCWAAIGEERKERSFCPSLPTAFGQRDLVNLSSNKLAKVFGSASVPAKRACAGRTAATLCAHQCSKTKLETREWTSFWSSWEERQARDYRV